MEAGAPNSVDLLKSNAIPLGVAIKFPVSARGPPGVRRMTVPPQSPTAQDPVFGNPRTLAPAGMA